MIAWALLIGAFFAASNEHVAMTVALGNLGLAFIVNELIDLRKLSIRMRIEDKRESK